MAFMDMGPITTVVKSAIPPPPHAQPSVAEAMKPVPETEIQAPVPPPAKGAHPGLGEHLDLYDAPTREVQAEIVRANVEKNDKSERAVASDNAEKAAQEEGEKAAGEAHLLGNGTGLPQPSVEPVHPDLPFLKPLGRAAPLGQAIDERV
jgi:hypothetical protein